MHLGKRIKKITYHTCNNGRNFRFIQFCIKWKYIQINQSDFWYRS